MGNCIYIVCSTKLSNSCCFRNKEFGDPTVKSYNAKVHPDDDVPSLSELPKDDHLFRPPIPPTMPTQDSVVKPRTVKIVVTKKQLHKLLKNVKNLESTGTVVHFADGIWDNSQSPRSRWRPALDTIDE